MTKKGSGASMPPTTEEIGVKELEMLKHLFESQKAYTAQQLAIWLDTNIRYASSYCSRLVGLDLIKSTEYTVTLTEQEKNRFKTLDTPYYFIPTNSDDVYRRRAQNVINSKGALHNLEYINNDEKTLWPTRPTTEIEFELEPQFLDMVEKCGDIGPYAVIPISEPKMLQFLQKAKDHSKKLKVVVEIL